MLTFFIGIYEKYEKIVFWKFPESRVRLIRFGTVSFYTGAKHPQSFRLLKPMVKVPQGP